MFYREKCSAVKYQPIFFCVCVVSFNSGLVFLFFAFLSLRILGNSNPINLLYWSHNLLPLGNYENGLMSFSSLWWLFERSWKICLWCTTRPFSHSFLKFLHPRCCSRKRILHLSPWPIHELIFLSPWVNFCVWCGVWMKVKIFYIRGLIISALFVERLFFLHWIAFTSLQKKISCP